MDICDRSNLFPQFSEFVMPHHMRYIVSFRNLDFTILTLIFSQLGDCEGAGEVFKIVSPGYQEEVQKALAEGKQLKESDKHFFKKEVFMVVSSQLQLEALCNGLGNCYYESFWKS